MTITDDTSHASGLRDVELEELNALYWGPDPVAAAAAKREAERRDTEDRLARTRAKGADVYAEGEQAAYAQYRQAEEFCRGRMLSKAGMAAFDRGEFADEFALWRMPAAKAELFSSEELRDFWLFVAPRITPAAYVRQRAAARRGEYQQARDEREARNGLGGHEAGALRREATAGEAPQDGRGRPVLSGRRPASTGTGTTQDRTAGRATGPVHRDQRVGAGNMGLVGMAVREGVRSAQHHQHERQAAAQHATVAVPLTGPVVKPGTTVARNEQPIPGDRLLDLLRDQWFGTFARFPSVAALDAVTLWAAHTHMRDENGVLVFRATPRLGLFSSEPGSGKGRVLELLMRVVPACFGLDLEPTKSGLVHTLNDEHATVCIDEADILFGAGERKADVRSVLNGGTYRYGTTLNGKGGKTNRVPVFGPIALAGLDVMEKDTGDSLKALLSRFVKIRMVKMTGEDRPPKLTRKAEAGAAQAQMWLTRWAAQVRGEVADADPEIPEGVEGRAEDIWTPLLAVADAAGGDWPDRARAACRELALALPEGEDQAEEFAAFAGAFGSF